MDFSWSPEQLALKAEADAFARRQLNECLAEREARGTFDRSAWRACADFGVLGWPMPRPFGAGFDPLTTVLAMEGLGHGCQDNGLLFGLNAQLWSVQCPIVAFGTPAQKERYLRGMISGELIGAHSVTEPGHGSDVFNMRTTATRDEDYWILNGAKTFITSAPVADVFLLLANTGRSKGASGLTAFLVERDTRGLTATRHLEKMGLRTSPMGEVVLDDVRVNADQMLGPEGAGTSVFNLAMEWERSFLLAAYLGTMQRQIEMCVKCATVRDAAGKPIGKDDTIGEKIVEMNLRLEAARLLNYKVAWLKGTGRRLTREPSEVKLITSETFVKNSDDALQIHGAAAYLETASIERDWRDARASKIYSGTSEIQKMIVSRWFGV